MAEILIKGMEMPKYCRGCCFEVSSIHGPLCRITRKFTRLDDNEDGMKRHISCPLVEVPPHGDLIERSSVYKVLDDRIALYKEAGDEYNACNIVCIEGDIVVIPTIIEASKEKKIREISTAKIIVGEHIIVDGVEYVAEESIEPNCESCAFCNSEKCSSIPCGDIILTKVEIEPYGASKKQRQGD